MWACSGSLEMLWERREARQGRCQLTEKSEKNGALETAMLLPVAPLVANLVGSLRV